MMNKRTKDRAQNISKNRYTSLINEHAFLKSSRPEIYKLSQNATADKKWYAAKGLWDLQLDIGRRISALEESIYDLTIDPAHITYQLEQDADYEEKINEKIRLHSYEI